MRLLSTFSETMIGMEFMVRDRLKRRRSPDFLTGATAAAGGLGWAEVVTLVTDDVDVEESLLKTREQWLCRPAATGQGHISAII